MTTIGIDLGTSNSAAAVLRGGRPVIIPSSEGISLGGKAFPSYVALLADGQMLVGEPARRQAAANPEGTTTAFKRKMGQRLRVRLREREFSPEELSAFLLQKIKRDAEAFLGEPVTRAVVTVPAYFDDNQRSATRDAARIAGLDVVRLVNEPTAAALAYGLDRLGQNLRIAVIDLGGGTLDVTIMEFGKGVFEVKATSGDTRLGGTDMNQRLFDSLAQRFALQTGFDVRSDRQAEARLMEAAETAKVELSTSSTAHISLPFIGAMPGGQPLQLELDLTRADLERIVDPVVERCRAPVLQAIRDAQVTPQQIDRIVFVGGPTRMPVVRRFFEQIVGRSAELGVDPMECVAAGAAVQAGVLDGVKQGGIGDILLVDVTPLTLGVETLGGVATPLIARNTPVPVKKTESFTTAADMQTTVTVRVFQGERPMARDNVSLGEFNLDGLAPAPRGVPKIEVSFDIDASGLLDVTARDSVTGKSQSIRISGSTRLPAADKERMVKEAEAYAAADKRRRAEADQINDADAICYQGERFVGDFGSRLAADTRSALEAQVAAVKAMVANKDAAQATAKAQALKAALQQAGASIYATAGAAPAAGSPEAGPASVGPDAPTPQAARVVDAQFHETR